MNLTAALLKVRQTMRWLGFEVVERPLPKFRFTGSPKWQASYWPQGHEITLSEEAARQEAIIWHELCHSQQPDKGPISYRNEDGSIDSKKYWADPLEQEAMAVESCLPFLDEPWAQEAAEILPKNELPKWLPYVKRVVEQGFGAAPAKPYYIPKGAKLRLNAVIRKYQAYSF